MASRTMLTALYVLGLLVCGSLNTITLKISFSMTSVDSNGEEKLFQKPWFNTFSMFVAMTLALIFDKSIRRCEPCFGSRKGAGNVPLMADCSPGAIEAVPKKKALAWSTKVMMVSMPAVFDILATGLCSMGFLYIPASVWQLLRGAEMIFAAAFAVIFLGRKLYAYHWLGLFMCVLGIVSVGVASVWGDKKASSSSGSSFLLLLGMALALGGQVVQAAQVVAEEWLLVDVDLPEMQIVGFEGLWGMVVMAALVFPLLYFMPGSDNGHFEDEGDTLVMMQNSLPLLQLLGVYLVSCCTYNMAGLAVTGALSAVHRVMIEAMRTSIVWVFGLSVHYLYDPNSLFGEAWTPYSWLEVCGFFVLLLGQATYGAMLKWPGLYYPCEALEPHLLASPGSMRNLASPLPPAAEIELTLD